MIPEQIEEAPYSQGFANGAGISIEKAAELIINSGWRLSASDLDDYDSGHIDGQYFFMEEPDIEIDTYASLHDFIPPENDLPELSPEELPF